MEKRLQSLELRSAVDEVHRGGVETRLRGIEDTLKWLVRLIIDGAIGPQTIEAAQVAYASAKAHLADAYGIARRNYYYALADRRPTSRKYARRRDGGKGGWITRAEEFISPRYHLSEREHRQRVASWG